jgi:hypothetical protein
MRKHYDFSNAVKNPHAGKFKDGYTIVVEHKDYDEIVTIAKSKKLKDENGNGAPASTTAHLLNT